MAGYPRGLDQQKLKVARLEALAATGVLTTEEFVVRVKDLIDACTILPDAPPTPSLPAASSSAPISTRLRAIQQYICAFQYNYTGTNYFDVRKRFGMRRVCAIAKEIVEVRSRLLPPTKPQLPGTSAPGSHYACAAHFPRILGSTAYQMHRGCFSWLLPHCGLGDGLANACAEIACVLQIKDSPSCFSS